MGDTPPGSFLEAFGGFYKQLVQGTRCTGPEALAGNEAPYRPVLLDCAATKALITDVVGEVAPEVDLSDLSGGGDAAAPANDNMGESQAATGTDN